MPFGWSSALIVGRGAGKTNHVIGIFRCTYFDLYHQCHSFPDTGRHVIRFVSDKRGEENTAEGRHARDAAASFTTGIAPLAASRETLSRPRRRATSTTVAGGAMESWCAAPWENGWGGRDRTYNLRSQSPSLCQLSYAPKERPGAGEAKGQTRRYCDLRVSASSTADACAPCANRLSYARPCGRHGSETRRGAATNAYSRHIRPAHGQCRGGLHRPDQWYHHR